MQRKNIKHFAAGICLLFTSLFYCLSANADVLEGTSGQTLSGEYAVIINTDTSASQETGTLVFDDDDSTSSYSSAAATSHTHSFTSSPSGNSLSADNTPASSPRLRFRFFHTNGFCDLSDRRRKIHLRPEQFRKDLRVHRHW